MASVFASCSLILTALLILQCGYGIRARMTHDDHVINGVDMYPSCHVWFTPKDLHKGFKMPVYFAKKDLVHSPRFLPREESNSIPFTLSQYDNLLSRFSISKNTPQGRAIHYTLSNCDMSESHGVMACVTSLESMLDLVQKAFGSNTKFDVFTTITHPSENSPVLQNYTFLEDPQQFSSPKMLACHPMPYPYAVFYCHGHSDGSTRVFKIPLQGENGDKVEAIGVCHAHTSSWDEDHISFKMLNMKPRSGPVCHFIPHNNFVWLPSV